MRMREKNCLISTSNLKSDVTDVFLDPDFLHDAENPAIRGHIRPYMAEIGILMSPRIFRTLYHDLTNL